MTELNKYGIEKVAAEQSKTILAWLDGWVLADVHVDKEAWVQFWEDASIIKKPPLMLSHHCAIRLTGL